MTFVKCLLEAVKIVYGPFKFTTIGLELKPISAG